MEMLSKISPYIRLAHDFRCPPNWSLPRRRLNDHALLYIQAGRGTLRVGSKDYPLTPGTLLFIRPDTLHSFTGSAAPFHMLNLHFDFVQHPKAEKIPYARAVTAANPRKKIETVGEKPGAPDYLLLRLKINLGPAYERLFSVVLETFQLRDLSSQLRLKAAFLELLAFVFRQVRAQAVSRGLHRHLPQLERGALFMSANTGRPLALAEMARSAAMSRSYFAASFRAYYGVSPAKFHLRQRIEKAATELIFGARPIKDVAERHGFQTVHHFARCFRQVMGVPPAAFRVAHGLPKANPG